MYDAMNDVLCSSKRREETASRVLLLSDIIRDLGRSGHASRKHKSQRLLLIIVEEDERNKRKEKERKKYIYNGKLTRGVKALLIISLQNTSLRIGNRILFLF